MTDAVINEESCRRLNSNFKAEEISFRARIDMERTPQSLIETPNVAAVEAVHQIFVSLLERCSSNLRPNDLIRFVIQSDDLDKPISMTYERVRNESKKSSVNFDEVPAV